MADGDRFEGGMIVVIWILVFAVWGMGWMWFQLAREEREDLAYERREVMIDTMYALERSAAVGTAVGDAKGD